MPPSRIAGTLTPCLARIGCIHSSLRARDKLSLLQAAAGGSSGTAGTTSPRAAAAAGQATPHLKPAFWTHLPTADQKIDPSPPPWPTPPSAGEVRNSPAAGCPRFRIAARPAGVPLPTTIHHKRALQEQSDPSMSFNGASTTVAATLASHD